MFMQGLFYGCSEWVLGKEGTGWICSGDGNAGSCRSAGLSRRPVTVVILRESLFGKATKACGFLPLPNPTFYEERQIDRSLKCLGFESGRSPAQRTANRKIRPSGIHVLQEIWRAGKNRARWRANRRADSAPRRVNAVSLEFQSTIIRMNKKI